MANRIKVNKPTGKEDQSQAILRAIAMKRETYFQLILSNLLRNEKATHETMVTVSGKDGSEHSKVNILDIVDTALEGADYVIEKLYPIKAEATDE
jgi:phosphoribosylaminoimidazole-succinocarboxamide synthase